MNREMMIIYCSCSERKFDLLSQFYRYKPPRESRTIQKLLRKCVRTFREEISISYLYGRNSMNLNEVTTRLQ